MTSAVPRPSRSARPATPGLLLDRPHPARRLAGAAPVAPPAARAPTGSEEPPAAVPAAAPTTTTARRPPRARRIPPLVGASRAAAAGIVAAALVVAGAGPTAAPDGRAVGARAQVSTGTSLDLPVRTDAARLTALAAAYGQARRTDATAVGHAALDAAQAAQALAVADPGVVEALADAAARLDRLVSADGPRGAGPVLAPRLEEARADVSLAGERAGTDVVVAGAVAAAAGEVFHLSMQAEVAAAEAARSTGPAVGDLTALEQAVAEASRAAEVFRADGPRTGPGEHPDGWSNGRLPLEELCALSVAPDERLRCDAAEAFEALNAAYREDHGRDLVVVSAYRSLSEQAAVRLTRGALAAAPGYSNHGWGIAVDLGGLGGLGQFDDPDYRWLKENAARFGWQHPRIMEPGGGGPQEPWHWEYVAG